MSVFTFEVDKSNPITTDHILELSKSLDISVPEEHLDDYKTLLAVFHDTAVKIMDMEDYYPPVDLEKYPREDVYFPSAEENELNAWAWKCRIGNSKSSGLLSGKQVVLKDCIALAGIPMLLGTNFVQDYTPKTDATLVTRILDNGGLIVGRAVCENMCHSATSHSAHTGPVHNPYAKGYSTGGSSSGCAALVANGDVDFAIGADQGGSIRIPSGWSGIVGFKPTFGLIPFTGCASNEQTNDHVGPMTKTVLDNALLLQAIAGDDTIDDRSFNAPTTPYYDDLLALGDGPISLKGMRIGILKEGMENSAVQDRIRESCLQAFAKFVELGAVVEEVSVPIHSLGPAIWTGISKVGGYLSKTGAAYGRRGLQLNDLAEKIYPLKQEIWDEAYPSTKNIYFNGLYAKEQYPGLLGKCQNLSLKLKLDYNEALSKYDVLVLPNLPYIANSHASFTKTSMPLEVIGKQLGVSANTCPFDQSGHPVLAVPCGMLPIEEGPLSGSGVKLPVSMQIVGKWYDEKTVYKVALAFERATNWKEM